MDHNANNANNADNDSTSPRKQGVRMKNFEIVVAEILANSIEPQYCKLNLEIDHCHNWPFNILPASARVMGDSPGHLKGDRAIRKEGQVRNILQIVPELASKDKTNIIVDFGGGSGHLGIPLALLMPKATVCVVDLRKKSLDLMHQKADAVMHEVGKDETIQRSPPKYFTKSPFDESNDAFRRVGKGDGVLDNLYSFHGPVEDFNESFDMAIALHLCGEATDVAMRKAANVNASIIAAPCCVGKLSTRAANPDIFNATGTNDATINYPQSTVFCKLITSQNDWNNLASAADYSNENECKTQRNAARRTAKALLETDRRLFLEEKYHYKTAMIRMTPWQLTPKNDIIIAWPNSTSLEDSIFSEPDLESLKDVSSAKSHLLRGNQENNVFDWTLEEEAEIENSIQDFLNCTVFAKDETMIFPTGMGPRKRKLIHFVANKMNMNHWGVGKKAGERTVAVARCGKRKRKDVQQDKHDN